MKEPIQLLWAGLATIGFALRFDLRLRDLPLASAGAILGWGLYATVSVMSSPEAGYFAAALGIGLWAELLSTFLKRPATIYIVTAIIPLVPGGGMYYTMLHSVRGELWDSIRFGFQTLMAAGAIAAGLAVSSAVFRLLSLRALARRLSPPSPKSRPKSDREIGNWSCNDRPEAPNRDNEAE